MTEKDLEEEQGRCSSQKEHQVERQREGHKGLGSLRSRAWAAGWGLQAGNREGGKVGEEQGQATAGLQAG